MKSAFEVPIIERRASAPGHVELLVKSDILAQAEPGQFCHVLTPGMLRRPISFSRLDRGRGLAGLLVQVVGSGTEWLYDRQVGDVLNVLGPLGRGFEPPAGDRPWLLVGGGVGIPPIFAAFQVWRGMVLHPIQVILGARQAASLIMVNDFRELGMDPLLSTDDGSRGRTGTVIGPVKEWLAQHPLTQVMACGPTPMLASVHRASSDAVGLVQLAMEQRMGCGIGACLACVVPANPVGLEGPRYRRVCTDGPVFRREELVF